MASSTLSGDETAVTTLAAVLSDSYPLALPRASLAGEAIATTVGTVPPARRIGTLPLSAGSSVGDAFCLVVAHLTDVMRVLGARNPGTGKRTPNQSIALAVTRDGMPVRSWVLPGNTADVATVARIKQDLHAWRLGRCLFVGDAGMYSADNLVELSRGLGRYVLAVPMRRVQDVEAEVLTRPGRYRQVAENLQVKEVWVGDGERRKRYVLCFNPAEAERQRQHRVQVLPNWTPS